MFTYSKKFWGTTASGQAVDCYTLENGRISAEILTYGGAVRSLRVPNAQGVPTDVVLGFDDLATYEAQDKFIGALIGRHANRIEAAQFTLDGITYPLYANDGRNQLHGGRIGYDRRVWDAEIEDGALVLSLLSPDGEEGFPGTVRVQVRYSLTETDGLRIDYTAETDQKTVCNLTNHSYFNLAGHDSGSIADQQIALCASFYTPANGECLPDGTIAPVDGTPMDLREMAPIGAQIDDPFEQLQFAGGYDHNWIVDGKPGTLRPAAQAFCPQSGIRMTVLTTCPGLQFYSGNSLDGCPDGKGGAHYARRCAFCLETQYFPNSLCHPAFPQPIIQPDRPFCETTIYEFSAD